MAASLAVFCSLESVARFIYPEHLCSQQITQSNNFPYVFRFSVFHATWRAHCDIPPFLLGQAHSLNLSKRLLWVIMWFEHVSLRHLHNSATRRRQPVLLSINIEQFIVSNFLRSDWHKGSSHFSLSSIEMGIYIFLRHVPTSKLYSLKRA